MSEQSPTGNQFIRSSARDGLRPPPIPDYELLERIGRGSYGEVWRARNVLRQWRAVKIIYRERFVDPRPFEREFEGIQRFEPISRSHPSQLHILHVGKNDAAGCFYYVMELADAARTSSSPSDSSRELKDGSELTRTDSAGYTPHTLRHELERHTRLPIPDCVQIGLSLTTALAHLHGHKLVHRDIKPSNIIFVSGVAKLGDIGLVTEAGDTQSIVGTEGYLPPEGPGTPRADIYSLGKVLYEISTGMDRRRFAELPEELRTWPDAAAVVEFNEIVLKACAKDPAQRYGSANQMRADLELLQQGQSVKGARLRKQRGRLARKLMLVAIPVVMLGAILLKSSRGAVSSNAEGGPPSTNEMANTLYAKAIGSLRLDNYRSFADVYTNLHQAIKLDANFARPYVGLLELVLREPRIGFSIPSTENERTITQRLIDLAPHSGAAYCGQAIVAFCDFDFPQAEQCIQRAIRIAPQYELGHTWYGYMLENWMRPVEARQQLKIARGLNSSKVQIFRCLALSYHAERNFPSAIEMYREAISISPHDTACYLFMARAYRAMEDYREAIDVYEKMETVLNGGSPRPKERFDRLRQAFTQGGETGYWEEELRQAPTNELFAIRSEIHVHLNNFPEALTILEKSFETRERHGQLEWSLPSLLLYEFSDKLRDEPRFQALIDKMGFTKVNPRLKEQPFSRP